MPCSGVRKGAERTVAVADGVVYYLGNDGVYAFDGSMPVCVSRALGDKRYTGGVAGGDITQGLPRVEELFEARKPKKMATLSEIAGKVRFEDATKGSLLNIIVTADDGDTRTYSMPHTGLQVRDGEVIEKGRQLQDGALNPHDVLRIRGASAVHNYLIQEVLKVYRQQGVDINDKHIEVIVRQMMRKVRVEDANDATGLLSGAMADVLEVEICDGDNVLYAGKAADEQKAAGDVRYGSGRTVEGEKPQSLSSTASDSLERAMGNYLKARDTRSAQNLITLYKERMTPTQKKRFSALFDKYGAAIGW